ncbi:MAG TPA: hypothetical protein PLR99_33460 [Polyangiaceae bacterium]|jgi:hypothetical protein|nr:hypothetical protein [Polyangiaceae bacterium]
MLITFVVSTTLVLGGMALGRVIARSLVSKDPQDGEGAGPPTKEAPAVPDAPAPASPLDGFPCQLGDVLTRPGGDEAWLAGALVLSEDVPVAVLFIAPDAGHDRAIYTRREADAPFLWLKPVDAGDLVSLAEPPSSIEHEGVRFERRRRLPLSARRIGTGAPDVGASVIVAEYASPGTERMLVMQHEGRSRVWHGDMLEPGMVDVLPSGRSTLE